MAKKNINTDNDQLLAEFKALVSDTEQLLQHSVELSGDKAEELREQINSSLQRARKALGSTEHALRERGKEAIHSSEEYVREHPLQSLAIGAGVGFLLGLLVSRR
ncbi:YqjD family protein [Denitrificimonas sp. JX-1]|uniref:YqjD family protein n=1 Tax=Denitrificimonas halotolerans TaxID=3098930 RepID=A0ABU5GQB0_9GAMM|nr:YqjD family protein [Denitrificimonas sp. JX-1]MDY7219186.1 YqjD family protein [Denitrificimonas sp. JX-1]